MASRGPGRATAPNLARTPSGANSACARSTASWAAVMRPARSARTSPSGWRGSTGGAVALPGAALSPGASTCNFANAPTATPIAGLVLLPIAGRVTSAAVTVALPAVLKMIAKVLLPLTSPAFAGKAAFGSVEVIATVSFVFTTFQ